jgi:hypothetical protein
MDINHERYFFLSGIIAISFFLILLFIAGYSIILSPKTEQFAMIKSDVINVSISLNEVEIKNEPENITEAQNDPLPEVIKEPASQENPKETKEAEPQVNISDLFSQVKVDKTHKKKEDDLKRRDDLNHLEKELLQTKERTSISEKVTKLELTKPSVKMVPVGGSTGPLVNEYHAKIQAMVHTNFHPPAGTVGEIAKVRMSFSSSGQLISYKIIRYSGNGTFNSEVEWLKDRLSVVRFPEHPEGRSTVLEFILAAKE